MPTLLASPLTSNKSLQPQGKEFFTQDFGPEFGGAQWVHLSKNGACQLGYEMADAYMATYEPYNRPDEYPL